MTGSVDFCFALLVGCTRTETVQDLPGARAGSCCFSGCTEMPLGAFTRSEPRSMPAVPVLVIVNFTILHLPPASVRGFGLAIERVGAPGRVGGAGGPADGDGEEDVDPCEPEEAGSAGGGGEGAAIEKKTDFCFVPSKKVVKLAQLNSLPTVFKDVYASVVVLPLSNLLGNPSGSPTGSGGFSR